MSRERWGTFSVRDHMRKQPFAADVLMYDRLIIPRPDSSSERKTWSESGWGPKRLDSILNVLRADENSPKGHAISVPWNQYTRELFRQRAATANIVDKEANYGLTARLLAKELRPPAPEGVIPVAVLAAYPSIEMAQKEWIPNEDQKRRETLTMALAHRFLVPEPKGKTDLELLKEAVDLADDSEFRTKRALLYQWQDDAIRAGISDATALEEMAEHVDQYNVATKKAVGKVYVKFAFTLIPVGITAFAGPLAPAVAAGAIANLVRFWIFDRKPLVQAGESQAAAMFHTVREELGWRVAGSRPRNNTKQ